MRKLPRQGDTSKVEDLARLANFSGLRWPSGSCGNGFAAKLIDGAYERPSANLQFEGAAFMH